MNENKKETGEKGKDERQRGNRREKNNEGKMEITGNEWKRER